MDHSPLNRLSGELRNIIYTMALVQSEPVKVNAFTMIKSRLPRESHAALLQTCRQISAEASSVFYGDNTFLIPPEWTHRLTCKLLSSWLGSLRAQTRHQLRNIRISYPTGEPWTDAYCDEPTEEEAKELAKDCREVLLGEGIVSGDVRLIVDVEGEDVAIG